ncbi:MAG: peptidylprolyl isomerase [Gammaproteobacteria bacterium]|nr:peptidylprolyl isomerase [Gammaproteobacteria bacterium]
MKKLTLSAASLLLVTLFTNTAFALDKNTVASVNGKNISQKQYEEHLKLLSSQAPQGKQAPINRQAVLNDLINKEILLQEAKKKKLDKDNQVKVQLEKIKNNLMVQVLLSKSPAAKAITDKELQEVYDQQIGKADPTEYKARHILVKDEAKAKELIAKLNDGADFEETAKNESTGPSGKNGGDLGWFSSAQMVPAFTEATAKLMKGTHSQEPVKTRFGFHIIKLEDSRIRELPKFEEVKEQIRPVIQNQRLQEYVMQLRSKAKIEVK